MAINNKLSYVIPCPFLKPPVNPDYHVLLISIISQVLAEAIRDVTWHQRVLILLNVKYLRRTGGFMLVTKCTPLMRDSPRLACSALVMSIFTRFHPNTIPKKDHLLLNDFNYMTKSIHLTLHGFSGCSCTLVVPHFRFFTWAMHSGLK